MKKLATLMVTAALAAAPYSASAATPAPALNLSGFALAGGSLLSASGVLPNLLNVVLPLALTDGPQIIETINPLPNLLPDLLQAGFPIVMPLILLSPLPGLGNLHP